MGRATLAALGVLTVTACTSGSISCSPCLGHRFNPNALIVFEDRVASVRVCVDSLCQTIPYPEFNRVPSQYAGVIADYLRNRDRIERMEVTTFDSRNKVVQTKTGTSIDLPNRRRTRSNPCDCFNLTIGYDTALQRFVISAD